MSVAIVGWAQTPFGKFDNESVESLIVKAVNDALAYAGVAAADVDEIYLGHFNAGFSKQDFTASLVLQADDGLRFKPATRVENACATGSAAIHQGIKSIESGRARIVLAVGVEQMSLTSGPEVGANLLRASYLREESHIQGGLPVFLDESLMPILRNTAISQMLWPRLPQRITRTGFLILTPRCERIWDMTFADRSVKKTRWLPAH